ncbi:hypothetical protein [Microbispora sp. NPDC046933]|uniref:hypothetical protein n=1 Tax=Microbispora sp. NPDC046933 TaxID=3155618 RepID=UPI0034052D4F
MTIGWQIQRVNGQLLHRETKTHASDATLPFPNIVTAALRVRLADHRAARAEAGEGWHETGLVFTTASGRPIEPSNFRRSFANACAKAKVRKVHVHATRKTPARRSWSPSTFTRAWRCRSFGTARSQSR